MGIREKRLENDFKELTAFVNSSCGKLAIISTQGQPPHQYVIEYRCRGIEKLQGTEPVFRTTHRVEINIGSNYPKEKPDAKFLTPIFHPNVYSSLRVCLGTYWTMAETLLELVLRIGKIIQYSDDVLNLKSPANSEAKNWATNNLRRFPVDKQTFKSSQKPTSTIVCNDL
ncbi:ubiquitin-conjugating enzyme E2 [Nodularia spumigena CS-591/04]|uniref:ubiquitin-conjugating enzyme E2 n=1 Tax=Nodularia spumigena TaxID=70799 RepID=UPI00232BD3A3|nr:ubiquitin-conjugating enzyme E2 [Nodularia spumigena]MDB9322751.1 ubiquitin-conjugating enzyme E2 [Nodularia spumigena CS-591/07A]MDB9330050.1 ubiquitin-conjugating enzyme E2 [Nodularia spumigena CS-591/04]MDB9360663.1 ubiquitin-conjugating enzyme E2 [Nodularia spumigena CS-588/02]MDB9365379.1 ubiquitin-conjugating enzyme E2 [Nodularia spumigena CS-588/02A10]